MFHHWVADTTVNQLGGSKSWMQRDIPAKNNNDLDVYHSAVILPKLKPLALSIQKYRITVSNRVCLIWWHILWTERLHCVQWVNPESRNTCQVAHSPLSYGHGWPISRNERHNSRRPSYRSLSRNQLLTNSSLLALTIALDLTRNHAERRPSQTYSHDWESWKRRFWFRCHGPSKSRDKSPILYVISLHLLYNWLDLNS